MGYVQVPVPEEHVLEVMQTVVRLVMRATLEPWDDEPVQQFFLEADEPARSLLSVVARTTLAGNELTDVSAADAIQLNVREIVAIMREINDRAKELNRPILVLDRQVTVTLPNARTRKQRVLTMADNVARMVRNAERAEQAMHRPLESGTR